MEIFFTQQVAEELAGAVKDEIQATYGCVVTEICPHVPEHGTGGMLSPSSQEQPPCSTLNFTRALTMSILTKNKSRGSLRPQNWKY